MTPDLLEILDAGVRVPIGKGVVEVFGVSINDMGVLMRRFPALVDEMMAGGKVSAATIMLAVPESVPFVLAAGLGELGDAATEKAMARLSANKQMILLDAIITETMGGERGPFVERALALARKLGFGEQATPAAAAPQGRSTMSFRPRSNGSKTAATLQS